MALQLRKFQLFGRTGPAQRAIAKERRARFIRTVTISVICLVLLAVGGGLAYTWYNGQRPASGAISAPIEQKPKKEAARPQISDKANVNASIQMLSSPVAPGDNAAITVRTNPNALCTIVVEYDGKKSTDTGLIKKTADEFGMVDWTWTVDETAPKGKWPVTVTCKNTKKSGQVIGELIVKPARS